MTVDATRKIRLEIVPFAGIERARRKLRRRDGGKTVGIDHQYIVFGGALRQVLQVAVRFDVVPGFRYAAKFPDVVDSLQCDQFARFQHTGHVFFGNTDKIPADRLRLGDFPVMLPPQRGHLHAHHRDRETDDHQQDQDVHAPWVQGEVAFSISG
jgi:hypothetical protein